jgi:hypothetical protein
LRAPTEILLLPALLALGRPAPAAAQSLLDEFSYEGMRLAGVGVDLGVTWSNRLERRTSASLRIDAGWVAPHIRPLLSVGFLRADYAADEIDTLEARMREVVTDPTNDFTIDIGTITLTDFALDLDLQYLPVRTGSVFPYVGAGLGVHIRDANGAAIAGTFIEDGLQAVVVGLNGTAGIEVALLSALRMTVEARGVLASGLNDVSLRGGVMYRLPQRGTP